MNIAQMDQAKEALKDLAEMARTHYIALIDQGFDPFQALQLTVAFQRSIITSSNKNS